MRNKTTKLDIAILILGVVLIALILTFAPIRPPSYDIHPVQMDVLRARTDEVCKRFSVGCHDKVPFILQYKLENTLVCHRQFATDDRGFWNCMVGAGVTP